MQEEGLNNIVKRCKEIGIDYLQLVLEKSVTGFENNKFSEDYAKEIKNQSEDRKIAILGSYINPSNPNKSELDKDLEKFKEKIRYASILKPLAVGTETGIYYKGKTDTEEAYQYLLKNIKEIVSYAEEYGVDVAIEGVHCFVINSPQKLARLLSDVNSNNLKAIFDPVNYLNIENYTAQDEIIKDAFRLLGNKIAVIHAKDFCIENNRFVPKIPGEGLLNYSLIFSKMEECGLDVPIICEEIDEKKAVNAFGNLENIRKSI